MCIFSVLMLLLGSYQGSLQTFYLLGCDVRLRCCSEQSGAVYCQVGFNSWRLNSAESLFLAWREHRTVLTPVWEQCVRFYWHHSPAEDWKVTNLSLERTAGFWRLLWPHQSTTDNRRTFALMSVGDGSSFNWWEGRMCVTIFVCLAKTEVTPESTVAGLSAAALP